MVLTLRLFVSYGSQNKLLLPATALKDLLCRMEMDSVYCAVPSEYLHKTDAFHSLRVNL